MILQKLGLHKLLLICLVCTFDHYMNLMETFQSLAEDDQSNLIIDLDDVVQNV